MNKILSYLYSLDVQNIIEITPNIHKIITTNNVYILKEVSSMQLENIYARLSLAKLPFFALPIKSINNKFIEEINQKYYILSYYYHDENNNFDEVKMNFYLKSIAYLHQNSIYPLKVNDGYFTESMDYIENRINIVSNQLENEMSRIEKNEYYSPFEWYLISSYNFINQALSKSKKYLDAFKDELEKLTSVELTLTYQNYQINHILIKEEKIISLEKMHIAPPFYDLIDFIEKNYNKNIDISKLLENYFNIYNYNLYQKYWLLSLLFIPKLELNENQLDSIQLLYLLNNYLETIDKIESNLFPQTD